MPIRVGPTQRVVLLCLSDGTARPAARIDDDMRLDPGRAAGALRGLWSRGLVDPQRTGVFHGTEWSLTAAGAKLAAELFPDPDADDAPPVDRCPHGTTADEPCRDCRTGPWRCSGCGDTVLGGQRAPHRFDAHGDQRGAKPSVTFAWAG